MKKRKLFVGLMAASLLVACGGNKPSSEQPSSEQPSSEQPSSEQSSSETPVISNKELFKELFDSLGTNYYSFDYYTTLLSTGTSTYHTQMVVEPHAMYNYGLREGIALAKTGIDETSQKKVEEGYRFTIDMDAQEGENPFIPQYVASNYLYVGNLSDQGYYPLNQNVYDVMFGMVTIQDMLDTIKSVTGAQKLGFEDIFVEGKDADNNLTYTAKNPFVGLILADNVSFGLMDGSNENYFYDLNYYLESQTLTAFTTTFTVMELDGLPSLNIKIDIEDAVELEKAGGKLTFIDRTMLPLANLTDVEKDGLEVSSMIPDTFYENGPGEASSTTKTKLAEFKAYVDVLKEKNNYTLYHDGLDQQNTMSYQANVYSDRAFTFAGSNFTYGYYYLDPLADFSNASEAGIRVYSNNEEGETEEALVTLERRKQIYVNSGFTVDEKYVASATNSANELVTVNLVEDLYDLYAENFNQMIYLKQGYDNLWNNIYGGSYENTVFYNEVTDTFIVTNHFLKSALFGYDTLFSNYSTCATLDVILMKDQMTADVYTFEDYQGQVGYYSLGKIHVQSVGTTVLPESFSTFVDTKFGTNFGGKTVVA